MIGSPISVFVSSTCYDLCDLRAELSDHLTRSGFIVRRSEDPQSAFYVDPNESSIASCLANVLSSDVVVCILDRRYGEVINAGPHQGKSATHAEIEHARNHKKPVFFFVRSETWREYQELRTNEAYQTKWMEPNDPQKRKLLFDFMQDTSGLPNSAYWSNWCDLFETSVDLAPIVSKRLVDKFPSQAGTLARHPDRFLRLFFNPKQLDPTGVSGYFRNAGIGSALNVVHGFEVGAKRTAFNPVGALLEGEFLGDSQPVKYVTGVPLASVKTLIFCEYDNRFGDKYRVEVPIVGASGRMKLEPERVSVGVSIAGALSWIPL